MRKAGAFKMEHRIVSTIIDTFISSGKKKYMINSAF